MHLIGIAQVLFIVVVANGAPVLAKRLLGDRGAWPADFGMTLADGGRLFGASKTIRGLAFAVVAGFLCAPLIGLHAGLGTGIAAWAMAGDLLSSFCKRRLKLPPSSQVLGLDQVPESLLPLLWCAAPLGFTWIEIVVGVISFAVGELMLSPLLFRLRIRDRPY